VKRFEQVVVLSPDLETRLYRIEMVMSEMSKHVGRLSDEYVVAVLEERALSKNVKAIYRKYPLCFIVGRDERNTYVVLATSGADHYVFVDVSNVYAYTPALPREYVDDIVAELSLAMARYFREYALAQVARSVGVPVSVIAEVLGVNEEEVEGVIGAGDFVRREKTVEEEIEEDIERLFSDVSIEQTPTNAEAEPYVEANGLGQSPGVARRVPRGGLEDASVVNEEDVYRTAIEAVRAKYGEVGAEVLKRATRLVSQMSTLTGLPPKALEGFVERHRLLLATLGKSEHFIYDGGEVVVLEPFEARVVREFVEELKAVLPRERIYSLKREDLRSMVELSADLYAYKAFREEVLQLQKYVTVYGLNKVKEVVRTAIEYADVMTYDGARRILNMMRGLDDKLRSELANSLEKFVQQMLQKRS